MGYYEFPHTRNYDTDLSVIIEKMKKLLEMYGGIVSDLQTVSELRKEVEELNALIRNFDDNYIREVVDEYIPSMILPEISDSGYFILNIPKTWNGVIFKTTGLDFETELQPNYGHLCLLY